MSKAKYRPQYTLEEVQSIVTAIKYAVENGSTDPKLPAIYNKMMLFLYKCDTGLVVPHKVARSAPAKVPPASAQHTYNTQGNQDTQDTPAANVAQSAQDTLAAAKDTAQSAHNILTEEENSTLAQDDARTFEELSYQKLKMFDGDESKLSDAELLAASAHKVNKRMDVTAEDMERAQKYLMNSILGE